MQFILFSMVLPSIFGIAIERIVSMRVQNKLLQLLPCLLAVVPITVLLLKNTTQFLWANFFLMFFVGGYVATFIIKDFK